jgi:plastocyanin
MIKKHTALLVLFFTCFGIAFAANHNVGQKNKKFTVDKLVISVGDTVHFPNHDDIHHNVYSISDAKVFDLGSYGNGESKSVTFDKPGIVDVECAIHPTMHMVIEVK